jgi:hypothetical protein
VLAQALPRLQPIVVRDYGQVEGVPFGQADASGRWGVATMSSIVEALPTALFAVLVATTLLASGIAALDLLVRGPVSTSESRLLPLVVVLAGVLEVYGFAAALIGAGLPDLGRHALLGQLAFLVLLGASPPLLAAVANPQKNAQEPSPPAPSSHSP